MVKKDFSSSINRRQLLGTGAAVTASAILPDVLANSATPDIVQRQAAHGAVLANFSAATARRLAEIARRNEIRREANLPLLPTARELRRMKDQETREEFGRFEAAHASAVWEEVLKVRRVAEGNPNWQPNWMDLGYQTQLRKILWEQFTRDTAP